MLPLSLPVNFFRFIVGECRAKCIYFLSQEDYVFDSVGLFICLSVCCLSVSNITQKVMNATF